MIAVRDSTVLNALYPVDHARLIRLWVTRDGRPVGWAVLLDTQMVCHWQLGSLRVGMVVDCLAEPGDEFAVAAMATRHLAHRGVDLIVTNQLHRDWCRRLRPQRLPEGPHQGWARDLHRLAGPDGSPGAVRGDRGTDPHD